jgi:hypothetical protein
MGSALPVEPKILRYAQDQVGRAAAVSHGSRLGE